MKELLEDFKEGFEEEAIPSLSTGKKKKKKKIEALDDRRELGIGGEGVGAGAFQAEVMAEARTSG